MQSFPSFTRKKQSGVETFFARRKPEDSELSIDKTIREQFNLIRISNNEQWPSFFYHHNTKYLLKIYKDGDEN